MFFNKVKLMFSNFMSKINGASSSKSPRFGKEHVEALGWMAEQAKAYSTEAEAMDDEAANTEAVVETLQTAVSSLKKVKEAKVAAAKKLAKAKAAEAAVFAEIAGLMEEAEASTPIAPVVKTAPAPAAKPLPTPKATATAPAPTAKPFTVLEPMEELDEEFEC